jgi:hypothetical protein
LAVLGVSWAYKDVLETILACLGHIEPSWTCLGWAYLGLVLGRLEPVLGRLGHVLGRLRLVWVRGVPVWACLELSWIRLGFLDLYRAYMSSIFCFISCPSRVSARFGPVFGGIGLDWGASGLGWDLFGWP